MASYSNPAIECGMHPYDGLMLAYLPVLDSVLQELYNGDLVAYAQDGVVIDAHGPDGGLRWWKVKNIARELNMPFIEPMWHGPVCEYREFPLERVVDDKVETLHMRAYKQGPWISLKRSENAQPEKQAEHPGDETAANAG